MSQKYKRLFEPVKTGSLEIKDRFPIEVTLEIVNIFIRKNAVLSFANIIV